MTNICKQCIFFLMTLMIITGCSKPLSPLLTDPHPYDAPLPPFSTPVTLEELHMAYYKYSFSAVVKKLMENDGANWRMVLDKIIKGDKKWIDSAAMYIRLGTEGRSKEELDAALAYALQSNPIAVLAIDGTYNRSISDICSWPFPHLTYDFVLSYGKKTLASLRNVKSTHWAYSSSEMCIRHFKDRFEFLKKEHREGRLP